MNEVADEAPVKVISPEDLARQRQQQATIPSEPTESNLDDVVMPPSDSFNTMADKLTKALAEMSPRTPTNPEPSSAPQPIEPQKKDDKAATSPPEPPPEQKTITGARAADWNKLKERVTAAEAQAAEEKKRVETLAKEYEEYRKKTVELGKVEDALKKYEGEKTLREKYEDEIKRSALERFEPFKQKYDERLNAAVARAKEFGGTRGEELAELLKLPRSKFRNEQINAIRDELDGVSQGQIDVALADYEQTKADREKELVNARQNYERAIGMQAEMTKRERELAQHKRDAEIAGFLNSAKQQYEVFKGQSPEEMEEAKSAEDYVIRFLNGKLTESEVREAPFQALEYRRLSKRVLPVLQKRLEEAEVALKEFQAAQPKPAGGGKPSSQQPGAKSTFQEIFAREWPQGNR